MNNKLNIAAVSLDIAWGDAEENRYAIERAFKLLPRTTDIVILPEMFSTGFVTDYNTCTRLVEKWQNSPTMNFLRTKAREYNMAVCGSLLIDAGGEKPVNRCVFIEPDGETTFYDKHHLFCRSDEAANLSPGQQRVPIVRYRGWNIALAVCYDIRFPVWTRNVNNGYDLLIVPANWPQSRGYLWEHLLIGRAIENQSYIAGVNRSGHDDFGDYDNLTFVFDFVGKSIGKAENNNIVLATLDKDALQKIRSHFPVVKDADIFVLR